MENCPDDHGNQSKHKRLEPIFVEVIQNIAEMMDLATIYECILEIGLQGRDGLEEAMIGEGLDTAVVQKDLSLRNRDCREGVYEKSEIMMAGIYE